MSHSGTEAQHQFQRGMLQREGYSYIFYSQRSTSPPSMEERTSSDLVANAASTHSSNEQPTQHRVPDSLLNTFRTFYQSSGYKIGTPGSHCLHK
jgi:hypothetical protein